MKNLKKDISRVKWFLIDVTAKVVILFCKIANIQYGIFLTWFEFLYKFIAVLVHWWYFIKKFVKLFKMKKVTQLLMIFFLINIFSVWRKYKFKKKIVILGFLLFVHQFHRIFFFFFCFLSSSGYILINLWIVVDWNEIEGKYCTTPQCYNTFFIFFRLDRRENKV